MKCQISHVGHLFKYPTVSDYSCFFGPERILLSCARLGADVFHVERPPAPASNPATWHMVSYGRQLVPLEIQYPEPEPAHIPEPSAQADARRIPIQFFRTRPHNPGELSTHPLLPGPHGTGTCLLHDFQEGIHPELDTELKRFGLRIGKFRPEPGTWLTDMPISSIIWYSGNIRFPGRPRETARRGAHGARPRRCPVLPWSDLLAWIKLCTKT